MIKSLTKEQWKQVEIDYKNKKITKEQYELMKKIREMPDDWRTFENGVKGIGYGTATGAWEGIQWYVGAKLAGTAFKGLSSGENSAVRIGIDSIFNAGDTPFRTAIEASTSDESLKEAWENQGGWKSVVTNLGIGLLGSTAGEFSDVIKGRKGNLKASESNAHYTLNKNQSSKIPNMNNINTIDDAIKYTLNKQGTKPTKEAINFIKKELEKGNYTYISKDGGLRDFVKASYEKANKFDFNSVNTIDDAIKYTLNKKGIKPTKEAINLVKKELEKGKYTYISKDGGLRDFVKASYEQANKFDFNSVNTIDDAIIYTLNKKGVKPTKETIDFVKKELEKGNYTYISKDGGLRDFVKSHYTNNKITIDQLFNNSRKINNKYGVDQGVFKDMFKWYTRDGREVGWFSVDEYSRQGIKLKKMANQEYMEFKNILTREYNFSYIDASKVISGIDSIGACSYADFANNIFGKFSNNPEEFKKRFGFDMFKKDGSLNDTRLLTDLYVFANSSENGGNLFFTDGNGKKYVNQRYQKDFNGKSVFNDQIYFSTSNGLNENLMKKYLKNKNCNIKANNIYVQKNWKITIKGNTKKLSEQEMNTIKQLAEKEINKGNQLSLGIYTQAGKPIRIIDYDNKKVINTTLNWHEGGGHALKITDMNKDGFIVSTWGKKALVPFEDLKNAGSFTVMSSEIGLK